MLDADEFLLARAWRLTAVLSVAPVPGGADGHVVHLQGSQSLAARIAALGGDDADVLLECAQTLYRAGIERAVGGEYL